MASSPLFGQQITEHLFVHTDRKVYVIGETIWMSLYCLDPANGSRSGISKIAYVELLDEAGKALSQARIDLKKGRGQAQFFIDPGTPSAIYYLRSYTQWMRNFSQLQIQELPIAILNPDVLPENRGTSNMSVSTASPSSSCLSLPALLSVNKQQYSPREEVVIRLRDCPKASLSVSVHKISSSSEELPAGFDRYPNGICSFSQQEDPDIPTEANVLAFPPEIRFPSIIGRIEGELTGRVMLNFVGPEADMYDISMDWQGQFQVEVSSSLQQTDMFFWSDNMNLSGDRISIQSPFLNRNIQHPVGGFLSESWRDLLESYLKNAQINHLYTESSNIRGIPLEQESQLPFYGEAEIIYKLDEYIRFPSLDEVFLEYINRAQRRVIGDKTYIYVWDEYRNTFSEANSIAMDTAALTLMDGVPVLNPDAYWNYDVFQIESIDIIPKRVFVGDQAFAGVVNFHTYDHNYIQESQPEHLVQKPYIPIQQSLQFHSPDYSKDSDKGNRQPDFRTTLFWNPNWTIQSQESSLSFYTGDDNGRYLVEITGMTDEGSPIYLTGSFEVSQAKNK